MVLLESVCAAAFSAGSAACLVKLLSPNSTQQQTSSDNDPFVATLFVTCLMGAFALWTVKGPHACWHPSSGAPWSLVERADGDGSSATTATTSQVQPQEGDRRGSDADERSMRNTVDEKRATSERSACEGLCAAASCDGLLQDNDLADLRLERQSSFVEMALSVHG